MSDSISGVNMRLDAGGVRELHWHQAAEWGFMSYGNRRVKLFVTAFGPVLNTVICADPLT